jgi:tRNA-dihydrouridine synthase
MKTQKVKADEHGIYVIVNGRIHRPQVAKLRFKGIDGSVILRVWNGPAVIDGRAQFVMGRSAYNEWDEVVAKMIKHSPYSNVGGEVWVAHGDAWEWVDGKRVRSDTAERWYHGQIYDDD